MGVSGVPGSMSASGEPSARCPQGHRCAAPGGRAAWLPLDHGLPHPLLSSTEGECFLGQPLPAAAWSGLVEEVCVRNSNGK